MKLPAEEGIIQELSTEEEVGRYQLPNNIGSVSFNPALIGELLSKTFTAQADPY